MNSAESEWEDPHPVGHHVIAATVAAMLSLALHVGAGICLSEVRLTVPLAAPRSRPDHQVDREHMRLQEVKRFISGDSDRLLTGKGALRRLGRPDSTVDDLALAPDLAVIQPPAVEPGVIGDGNDRMPQPSEPEDHTPWQARPEIMAIETKILTDNIGGVKRWEISGVERVRETDDIIWPSETDKIPGSGGTFPASLGGYPSPADPVSHAPSGSHQGEPTALRVPEQDTKRSELFKEEPKDVTPYKAIEEGLTATVQSFSTFGDKYQYFMIKIDREQDEILPVLPKDVIFVQDCSASMAEQRLYFCKAGLTNCLTMLGPQDRFNVMNFRDQAKLCFPGWAENSPGNIEKARAFVMEMSSKGNTDIFASIRTLIDLERKPQRPVIALVVTDGRSTVGVTRSSDIIGEFSKLNDGRISVFTMGTIHLANKYLLDLLSYCNRGDERIAAGGRWGIPDSMVAMVRGISRPVVSDMTCHFGSEGENEVYPVLTSNLYLDKSFILYGRCPKSQERLVFQVRGKAGDLPCDMVFDLDLTSGAKKGGKDLRTTWAAQKIYYLIGEYARSKNLSVMKAIKSTAHEYRVKVPYEGSL